jgi:hypothetical protein
MALTADEVIEEARRRPQDAWFYLKGEIRRAIREDVNASLAGEAPTALVELKDAVQQIVEDIDELLTHDHQWNEDDRCAVCGADGLA